MPRSSWAQITVGGRIPVQAFNACLTAGYGSQWCLPPCDQILRQIVTDRLSDHKTCRLNHWTLTAHGLTLACDEIRNGMFDTIEEWLQIQNIPFYRETGGCHGEWLPAVRAYIPLEINTEYPCDEQHNALIHLQHIHALLKDMITLDEFKATLTREYPVIPPLPPVFFAD
ncbi:MAG: hypothetical protein Q8S75_12185 [Nitrospirota bacterium]|nr:hypothetical protein [Nitrospirota bacterium]